jgi:hypothetical protein
MLHSSPLKYSCKSKSHKCICELSRVSNRHCKARSKHNCICLKKQQYIKFSFECKANVNDHPCICYLNVDKCKSNKHECICSKDSKNSNCQNKHKGENAHRSETIVAK